MPLMLSQLTEAMQAAFKTEFRAAKGTDAPEAGSDDRRVLFAAVARGLLEYLDAHEDDLITSITFEDVGGQPVSHPVTATKLAITTEE